MLRVFEKIASLRGNDTYAVLSRQDIRKIDENAHRVLSEIGFKAGHPRAIKELKRKGYNVDGDVIKVRPSAIDKLLKKIPRHRDTRKAAKGSVHVGYMANQVYDAEMDRVRYPTRADLHKATIVALSIPEVTIIGPLFEPKDVPGAEDVLMLDVMMRRIKNPGCEILNRKSIPVVMDMCRWLVGSHDEILRRRMVIYYAFITSPLRYDFNVLDTAFAALDAGIPARFGTPMTMAGASAPVTLAGTLVMSLAETYTGLVMSDAFGQSWDASMTPMVMDQATGASLYAGPDRVLLNMASADLYRYLDLGGGVGQLTGVDACKPGIEAAIEKTYTAMLNLMVGHPPVIALGGLLGPAGLVGSIEQILIDAEVISMLNRLVEGIEVSDDTMAFDVIKELQFSTDYLSHEHTVRHFRNELWFPKLMKRLNPSAWNMEKPDMLEEAKKKVKEILASSDPRALSEKQERELDTILEKADIPPCRKAGTGSSMERNTQK